MDKYCIGENGDWGSANDMLFFTMEELPDSIVEELMAGSRHAYESIKKFQAGTYTEKEEE